MIGCMMILNFVFAGVYDDMPADGLFERIENTPMEKDASKVRDIAEVFVAKYPQDHRIHQVRLKLLEAYVESSKFLLAEAYSQRLLTGVMMPEQYREDIEYWQIATLVKKSQHWVAVLIKSSNVYRNIENLSKAEAMIEVFLEQYPRTKYLDAVNGMYAEIRQAGAEYQLGVALHYAKKGNFDAANVRLAKYFDVYGDVDSPILDQLMTYPELS